MQLFNIKYEEFNFDFLRFFFDNFFNKKFQGNTTITSMKLYYHLFIRRLILTLVDNSKYYL